VFFLITNAIFIAINCADIIYYRFTLKRTTGSVVANFSHETNLTALFFRFIFIDYWYITLLFACLIAGMVLLYRKTRIVDPGDQQWWIYYPSQLAAMLLLTYLVVGVMRGGFANSTRPITLSNAGRYVERPKEMAIVLNTPFSLFKTMGKATFQRVHYFSSESSLDSVYNPVHHPSPKGAFKNKNVVVFILESFGKEYFGAFNHHLDSGTYKGYTPFFDSLIEHSLSFERSYSNGGKSIDGIPSVISSLPSLKGSFVLSNYSTDNTPSLAFCLKNKGYYTAFFHGAPNGSMGFLAYTTVNGFDDYFGKTEYNHDEDYDGLWGIWDEEFFQFFAKTMDSFREPFMTTIFTVSSHHPFVVPKKYENKFPKGHLPMHQVIGYTDFALKRFFNTAKHMDWYKNTLFVFTADHTNQSEHQVYQTAIGTHAVPIIFFDPSGELHGMSNEIAQQIDIMPSVLGYLNYDQPYFSFGNDLFDEQADHFAISTLGNYYQLVKGDYFLQYDGASVGGFYNVTDDPLLLKNLKDQQLPQKDSLIRKVQGIIQQYTSRLIDNRLTVETN